MFFCYRVMQNELLDTVCAQRTVQNQCQTPSKRQTDNWTKRQTDRHQGLPSPKGNGATIPPFHYFPSTSVPLTPSSFLPPFPLCSLSLKVVPARSVGECCKLPRGLGRSPIYNRIWYSLALKCDIWWKCL